VPQSIKPVGEGVAPFRWRIPTAAKGGA
jgi:hypothetical protein